MNTHASASPSTPGTSFGLALALLAATACSSRPEPQGTAAPSVTVFPVLLAGTPSTDVANVVGIFLERGGLPQVELSDAAFAPVAQQDASTRSAAFAAFVQDQSLPTDQALLVDMLGTPGQGIDEIRTTLVDRAGTVVFKDCQKRGDPAFDRSAPKEPMDGCIFAVQRLSTRLALGDPMRKNAPESRLAARMQQKAGVPDQQELDAMKVRLATLRSAGGNATMRVFPAHVGRDWPMATATDLAARVQRDGFVRAIAAADRLSFTASKSMNQQASLWSGARNAQKALKELPPTDHYTLVCDFLAAGENTFGAVHTFVFSPDGSLVLADFQNSHHADFQAVEPHTVADCCELAARRLAGALRGD
ncbi:MAG: hypothetical protein ABL997_07030 [Planctomycetota bacterium]